VRPLALLLFLALVGVLGCASALAGPVAVVNADHVFLDQANVELAAMHRRARDLAVERSGTEPEAKAAVAAVHARFRPAWDGYDRARVAWLAAESAVRAALALEAAKAEPDLAHVTAALVALASAYSAFEEAARLLPSPAAPAPPSPLPASP
jgi:hypothetical protein